MQKSVVAVGEASQSGSKCFVPFVHIDSIAIDITCPMEETQPPQHDYFSIRGFVAGMRSKNLKMCSPFSSDDDDNHNSLPLLSVPKFRWWQCSHCIRETTPAEITSLEIVPANTNDFAVTTSRQNTGNKHAGAVRNNPSGESCSNVAKSCLIPFTAWHENDAADAPRSLEYSPKDESLGSNGGYVTFPYKRKPKLRSLADIMEEEKISAIEPDEESGKGPPKCPQRKKKLALEEGRATCSETVPTKRSKGHVTDAEKATKRVEISESEAATRFNLQVSSITKRVKIQKNRVKSRKLRQVDENRTILKQDSNENLEKSVTGFNSGPRFGGERENIPISSENCELSTEIAADNRFLVAPQTSKITEDALNLSLNTYKYSDKEKSFVERRGIPDLNESIAEKASAMSENLSQDVSEMRGLTLDDALERRDNDVEKGRTSDDIPMEIVELLAKKQQERAIESSCQKFITENISFPFCGTMNPPILLETNGGMFNFPHFQMGSIYNPWPSQFKLFNPLLSGQHQATPYSGSNSGDLVWPQRNGISLRSFSDNNRTEKAGLSDSSAAKNQSIPYAGLNSVDISAMQLLSLSDQRVPASLQVGDSSFLDKPSASCINHHNLNRNRIENQLLFDGSSFFSMGNQFKSPQSLHNAASENVNRSYLQAAQMPSLKRDILPIPSIDPRPLRSPGEIDLQICVLNQNPADFSIPEAVNEVTTSAKDMTFGKKHVLKQRLPPVFGNVVSKRKWGRRNSTRDEISQQQIQNKIKNVKKKY